MANLKKKSKK